MSTASSVAHSNGKASKLPKSIRDDVRMAVALKGYSIMKEGVGQTAKQQYETLYTFFHGDSPSQSSQLSLMCDGAYHYGDFYEEINPVITRKSPSNKEVTPSLVLKQSLTRDKFRSYYAGIDIRSKDLEKKTCQGPQ